MLNIFNKKRFLIQLIMLVFIMQASYSQSIKGIVLDEDKLPLEFVSVALLQPQDSLLVKYTSTNSDGKFEMSGFKEGKYLVQIYLMTYQADQRIVFIDNTELDLGIVSLKREVNQLNEVTINAIVPIKIKQDTVAFNAKAFKVKQDDNVEDLIKKLPGVQIDTDGTVNAQGEDVQKILVDGKEFFSNDMSIALKNLNADAIKSVQIIDEESDETRTTGVKDGEKTKIINLVLKEGKKSGYFGKAGAGIGTNDRYQTNFDLNRFTKNSQLALFGKLNNINNTGATVFRRDGSIGGSNSGFLTTGTAGANYNYEFKKDLNFNIDYYYGYSNREEDESSNRTEFTEDLFFTSKRDNTNENISNNHNINFSLRDRTKEGEYMEFRGKFKNDVRESDTNNSTVYFDENNNEETTSERITRSDDDRNNGSLNFNLSKKLNDKGRNLRVRSGISFNDNSDMNFQDSSNKFNITDSENFSEIEEITTRNENNKALNYNVSVRFMEPIIQHHFISFSTSVNNNNNDEDVVQNKSINEIEQDPFKFQIDYDKNIFRNQLGYVFSKDKIQLYVSGAIENLKQNLDLDNSVVIDNKYSNFLPKAMFNYEYKKGKRIRIRYEKDVVLPNLNQVTPVINDFNPLFISVGNTNITPEKEDDFTVMFISHDFQKATSLFSFIGYTKTTNAIVSTRTIFDNFKRESSFENFGEKSTLRGRLSLSKRINKIGLRYSLRGGANFSEYTTVINNSYNDTDSKSWDMGISLSNENKNKVDLTVGANYNFNKTSYSLQDQDRDYVKQNYYTKLDWDLTNSITFDTQFDYSLYTDNNFDSQTIPIWNMGVEYAFLKGKRGNLKLQVFDILDKNLGIERTSSDNYFEETFQTNLGTYAMLSFSYSIKPPTGKSSKRGGDSGRRRYHGRRHS